MAGRVTTKHLSLLCVCWLGHACSEAHGPSVSDEREVADEHAPAQAERDADDSGQAPPALARCEARDFDPSLRPDDEGPTSRCRYQVIPEGVDVQYVRVMVGERTLPLDHAPDGWMFEADTGVVRLLGIACDQARGGALVRIQNECDYPILISR